MNVSLRAGNRRRALALALGGLALAACDQPAAAPTTEPVRTEAREPPPIQLEPRLWARSCLESASGDEAPAPPPPPPPPPPPGAGEDATDDAAAILDGLAKGTSLPPPRPEVKEYPERAVTLRRSRALTPLVYRLRFDAERCDVAAVEALRDEHGDDESLYCAIALAHEACGDAEAVLTWTKRRVELFPDSVGARIALALRQLSPVYPDPERGELINSAIPADERVAILDGVIAALEAIVSEHPDERSAREAAIQALSLRALTREVTGPPKTLEELRSLVLSRRDLMRAWEHTRAIGEQDGLERCAQP